MTRLAVEVGVPCFHEDRETAAPAAATAVVVEEEGDEGEDIKDDNEEDVDGSF